jgi:hypothetical protein
MTKFRIISMSTLSRFQGMHIYMNEHDHNPPHFHVEYNGQEAVFGLNLKLMEGNLPSNKKKLLLEWASSRKEKLVNAWTLCQEGKKAPKISSIGHMLHVRNVKYLSDYKVYIKFTDNTEGIIDISSHIDFNKGPIWYPLKDISYFSKVKVNNIHGTLQWPNEVEIDPKILYGWLLNRIDYENM